jgi:uncharacterized protein (DUF486 family)
MRTILCLIASNTFMTYAWYGHLKKGMPDTPLFKLILISWGIAFFEYLFMVPANNHFGKLEGFSAFQLKTIQEVVSLIVFAVFAIFFLKEPFLWNYAVAFALIAAACREDKMIEARAENLWREDADWRFKIIFPPIRPRNSGWGKPKTETVQLDCPYPHWSVAQIFCGCRFFQPIFRILL